MLRSLARSTRTITTTAAAFNSRQLPRRWPVSPLPARALLQQSTPLVQCRFIQTNFPPPPRRRRWRRIALITFGLLAATLYAGWKYITFHRYPAKVAQKLRQALYAEHKEDFATALKYYIEALQEADKTQGTEDEMSFISDEYTGIQLKIAEMFETLGMNTEALEVYREIGATFIHALHTNAVPTDKRPDLIRRDLLVALKTAFLEPPSHASISKMALLVHISMAQKDLVERHPQLKEIIEKDVITDPTYPKVGTLDSNGKRVRPPVAEPRLMTIPSTFDPLTASSEEMQANAKMFEPYRDELFVARNLYSTLCLATGDAGTGIRTALTTTEWMSFSNCPLDQVLMSFHSVGAYLYIQGEYIESRNWQLRRALEKKKKESEKEEKGEEQNNTTTSGERSLESLIYLNSNEPKSKTSLKQQENRIEITDDIARLSFRDAKQIFNTILDTIKHIPSHIRRQGEYDSLQALTIYSLGVIQLHDGNLDKAQDLLREARVRAKGCGYQDLVDRADIELATVSDYKKAKETGDDAWLNGFYNRQAENPIPVSTKLIPEKKD